MKISKQIKSQIRKCKTIFNKKNEFICFLNSINDRLIEFLGTELK